MSRKAWLRERFEYLDTVRVRCRTCAEEMDVRAGRAWRHWDGRHGTGGTATPEPRGEGEDPAVERKPSRPSAPSHHAVGSREWAVQQVLEVIGGGGVTPEQKLKALDLLKEYQDFGTKRLDDEKEAEQSRLQWERVLAATTDLKEQERILLKDPAVATRLRQALQASQ